MNVPKDYKEFIELLNQAKVKYVIVGGYALAFHNMPRFTGDIDFFIEISADNASRIVETIDKFGFKNIGITQNDFLLKDNIIQLGYPPLRIDIITTLDGVSFKQVWKNKIKGFFGNQEIHVISKPDLIKNKTASGRKQDLLDLELLKKAKKKKVK